MKKILLHNTGNYTLVDDEDYDYLMNLTNKWKESSNHYAFYYLCEKIYYRKYKTYKIYMSKVIGERMGIDINLYTVDHIIRKETLNNQRNNLRQATQGQQNMNQGQRKDNIHGHKGISRNGKFGWMARLNFEGKCIYLGTFSTQEEAITAYDKAARLYYGEFYNPD